MSFSLSTIVGSLDADDFDRFLKKKAISHFKEDCEDSAQACSSNAALPPRVFVNEERLRMGFDHDVCECVFYSYTAEELRNTVKFLRMVREMYNGSDNSCPVYDTCFILADIMLHGEIDRREVFNRLHFLFVNHYSLVRALLWLGAPMLIWTRTEVEDRIRILEEFEERTRELEVQDRIREFQELEERTRELPVEEQDKRMDQLYQDLLVSYMLEY